MTRKFDGEGIWDSNIYVEVLEAFLEKSTLK